jgi:hypothetical protein
VASSSVGVHGQGGRPDVKRLGNPNGARVLKGKQVGNADAVAKRKANAAQRAADLRAIVDDIKRSGITSVRDGAIAVRELAINGVKAVRYLITNLYVASSSERCATVLGIVIFYGGPTYPSKRRSNPPTMAADLINECVMSKDNVWRFKSHTLRPVFMSDATPPSMEIDPNFLKHM